MAHGEMKYWGFIALLAQHGWIICGLSTFDSNTTSYPPLHHHHHPSNHLFPSIPPFPPLGDTPHHLALHPPSGCLVVLSEGGVGAPGGRGQGRGQWLRLVHPSSLNPVLAVR